MSEFMLSKKLEIDIIVVFCKMKGTDFHWLSKYFLHVLTAKIIFFTNRWLVTKGSPRPPWSPREWRYSSWAERMATTYMCLIQIPLEAWLFRVSKYPFKQKWWSDSSLQKITVATLLFKILPVYASIFYQLPFQYRAIPWFM